jgi:hypothetical protein
MIRSVGILYAGWVVFWMGLYGYASYTGWNGSSEGTDIIDPSVRSSPGGYRSFHFWHSGFQGGK